MFGAPTGRLRQLGPALLRESGERVETPGAIQMRRRGRVGARSLPRRAGGAGGEDCRENIRLGPVRNTTHTMWWAGKCDAVRTVDCSLFSFWTTKLSQKMGRWVDWVPLMGFLLFWDTNSCRWIWLAKDKSYFYLVRQGEKNRTIRVGWWNLCDMIIKMLRQWVRLGKYKNFV
jgi:hypothetical protein